MKDKIKGAIFGSLSAFFYGTNPLFALPMYKEGIDTASVLLYRYVFAAAILYFILKFFKKTSLKISLRNFSELFLLGMLFTFSSITLFGSFRYIGSGIACTVLFIYPVLVSIIMSLFFKEKPEKSLIFAIILTLIGIFFIYWGKNGNLNPKGTALIMTSAVTYAFYIAFVKTLPSIKNFSASKLSFYVILIGILPYLINLDFGTKTAPLTSHILWGCAICLAILPTIVSMSFLTLGIKLLGTTPAAILGALEPVTAICFGILLFNEQINLKIAAGIVFILTAVFVVITGKNKIRKPQV